MIAAKIQLAIQHEDRHHSVHAALLQHARDIGGAMTDDDARFLIDQTKAVLSIVPNTLSAAGAAAKGAGYERVVAELTKRLVAYWAEANDVVPDHLGMIGVLDDAYCTLAALDRMSKACAARTGRSLVDGDLGETLKFLHWLLGDAIIARLNALVEADMRTNPWLDLINNLAAQLGQMPQMPVANPVWGTMSTGQIVDHQVNLMRPPPPSWR
ncbi:hypothetical protein EV278_101440 [Caulobacter sp. BK020]|nr:hypothetical protein EV278_101440 [Caulobacter sp. BK020]